MFTRNAGRLILIAAVLTVAGAVVHAQQTVYKWTDEDGVVHFSDAPPEESVSPSVETVAIPKAPPAPTAVQSPATTAPASRPVSDTSPQPASPAKPPAAVKPDISSMSLADLDRRCDVARERKIAPLRSAEIANCKENRRNDPAWCERFNADFGDGGRTINGTIRPRMFDDLPECVDALNERNRRRR